MVDDDSNTADDPPIDFDVEAHPRTQQLEPLVAGQQITGLFSLEELQNDTVLAKEAKLFTNGLGCDLEHLFKTVVESHHDKQSFEKEGRYQPSMRVFAVCLIWARKQKRHFFRDALFAQNVFAKELQMSFMDYLGVRGWAVSLKKGNKIGEFQVASLQVIV